MTTNAAPFGANASALSTRLSTEDVLAAPRELMNPPTFICWPGSVATPSTAADFPF